MDRLNEVSWDDEAFSQHRDPILDAFANSHDDLTLGKVQIFGA